MLQDRTHKNYYLHVFPTISYSAREVDTTIFAQQFEFA